VKLVVVKVEKATTKEVHEAKKLAKLTKIAKLSSAKKLPKTLVDKREETFGCLNLESGEGGAYTRKESSKGEAFKDIVQVVEQFQSCSNSLESNEKGKENPEVVNILKKPIKASKQTKRTKEALEAQEAQTMKEAQEVRFQLEAEKILQAIREATWLEMELKWTKFRALQVEEGPSSLSTNAIAKTIKVLQTLMVNERETNMQLSLELKGAQKEKGLGQVEKPQSP
jgi:hypothetical protein